MTIDLFFTTTVPDVSTSAEVETGDTSYVDGASGDSVNPDAVTLVSVGTDGMAAGAQANRWAISADGRYVAFSTYDSNVLDDGAGGGVFLKDFETGTLIRVSTSSSGVAAWGGEYPSISDDGRYVAFQSYDPNLLPGNDSGQTQIYVKDLQTGAVYRASSDSNGNAANGYSSIAYISPDGRYVAFGSNADNLVEGDNNGVTDIYLKDLQTGTITRVTVGMDGGDSNGESSDWGVVSAGGRYVAFETDASNLVAGDTNNQNDVFLKDMVTGTVRILSRAADGGVANEASFVPSISPDGRYIVFDSEASNLVAGDTNGKDDVFLFDTQTESLTLISTNADGVQGNGHSLSPVVSDDGRFVAFRSYATNFGLAGDTVTSSLFVKDVVTGEVVCLSVTPDGTPSTGWSYNIGISGDGHYITFSSEADDLVPNDTNGSSDVFRVANPLFGGSSNVHEFGPGSGADVIDASDSGLEVVRLTGDIQTTDVQLFRDEANLYLAITGTADILTFAGWFADPAYRIETIEFADGTWDATVLAGAQMAAGSTSGTFVARGSGDDIVLGSAGADAISAKAGDDAVYSGAGNDMLDGGIGNDFLSGGNGDDTLAGGMGDDILNGGAGNDVLEGGFGNDVYQFGIGSGQDTIEESDRRPQNMDTLVFGADIDASQLWFSRTGNDLKLRILGTNDILTISGWYAGSAHRIEQFQTADNKLLLAGDVENLVRAMRAFEPPAPDVTALPDALHDTLFPVISANWK